MHGGGGGTLLKRKHTSILVRLAEGHGELMKADRGVYDSNPVIVMSLFLCHHCGVLLQEFGMICICACVYYCAYCGIYAVCVSMFCAICMCKVIHNCHCD